MQGSLNSSWRDDSKLTLLYICTLVQLQRSRVGLPFILVKAEHVEHWQGADEAVLILS